MKTTKYGTVEQTQNRYPSVKGKCSSFLQKKFLGPQVMFFIGLLLVYGMSRLLSQAGAYGRI